MILDYYSNIMILYHWFLRFNLPCELIVYRDCFIEQVSLIKTLPEKAAIKWI